MNTETLLEMTDITKIYKTGKQSSVKALNNVSLSINKGEILGLVGESGCGKSTLGQIAVQLLQHSSGSIAMQGKKVEKLRGKQLLAYRKKAQIIFQDPYSSLDPKKTIGWLVEEPLLIHKIGRNKSERREMVCEILDKVGLDATYLDRKPHELSGGQRQRVSIALALVLRPELVVCDEPVSALDVSVQAQILNLCKDLQKEYSLTYLFISHDLGVVNYLANRVAVMYLGTIVEMGSTDILWDKPAHPYTAALFSASLAIGKPQNKHQLLQGEPPNPANPPSGCVFHTRCKYCVELCTSFRPELKQMQDGRWCACHFAEKIMGV